MKASDIRRGAIIRFEGNPCRVMDFQHRTPGNLRAFVQVRMRDLVSGNTFDHRFSATENVEDVRLDSRTCQVLYRDATGVHVMDQQTYEQGILTDEVVGDLAAWLEPGLTVDVESMEGHPIGISLPAAMELEVAETAPVLKGATKNASTKPATLTNGVSINVPEFIAQGDRVRVDPRSGVYLERARATA